MSNATQNSPAELLHYEIQPMESHQGITLTLTQGSTKLTIDEPIVIRLFGMEPNSFGYATSETRGDVVHCFADLRLDDGTELEVRDTYERREEGAVRLTRGVNITTVGTSPGLRVGLSAATADALADANAWEFFLPGALYNRNDADEDGVEDYLGTYVQDLRDDKNGVLTALVRNPATGSTFALTRATVPQRDTLVTPDQLRERHFVQETDIGSLGLAPSLEQIRLTAQYPFEERSSFSLDTSGSGWSAYAPNRLGVLVDATYDFRLGNTADLTDAIWDAVEYQRLALKTARPTPGVTLSDSIEYRQLLTQLYYRKWDSTENAKEPAGYLVHFSPRDGITRGSLLEYGFSGDQTLLAYTQLEWGYRKNVPLYRDRARAVIDFFVRHCLLENGSAQGIYDPINDKFTHWFTGILMPFQYAENEEDTRRFVGTQMTQALLPIARELRKVTGNYLRTMCESFYPILLAYELDLERGNANPEWLEAGTGFGDFLLENQAADGSWFRAYDHSGNGLTQPAAWFGASYREQKSGTIFPISVLTTLHRITGNPVYLDAAEKAAEFLIENYVQRTTYIGGLNDTTHIKSVKTDAVGVMFLMRSLIKIYEQTKNQKYLNAAVKSAKILSSFVYLWDVPMPPDTLLARAGFKSTGWASCDVIASGSYLDDEFLEFTGDLVKLAEYSNNESFFSIAELVEYGMQHGVSTPDNDHGYVAPGIQTEGFLTSYWLSVPDATEFSGAVNKVKGDDNDTANGLINGQAAYSLQEIRSTYGTDDFDVIREQLFGHHD